MTSKEVLRNEIKKAMEDNKLNVGSGTTKKLLSHNKIEKILIASNCEETVSKDFNYYCSLNNTQISALDINSEELGIMCKKNFNVAVISILK